jgi:hypothetical protein
MAKPLNVMEGELLGSEELDNSRKAEERVS